MKKRMMTLFTRTPLHVGAGNSVGVVDSPIQRERHTRIPIIPGSSLKGVLADHWLEKDDKGKLVRSAEGVRLFGNESTDSASAGTLLIGEARVLAFPVRSAKGMFAWVTSPLALNRYARDTGCDMSGKLIALGEQDCMASPGVALEGDKVVLEEYVVAKKGEVDEVASLLKEMLKDNILWQAVTEHLVILSDSLFAYFVENACEVVTRIRVDNETGTAAKGGLFNQEEVPSETLFYAMIAEQSLRGKGEGAIDELKTKLDEVGGVLQVGANETIGLGFCDVEVK